MHVWYGIIPQLFCCHTHELEIAITTWSPTTWIRSFSSRKPSGIFSLVFLYSLRRLIRGLAKDVDGTFAAVPRII